MAEIKVRVILFKCLTVKYTSLREGESEIFPYVLKMVTKI